ncbi:MAG: hypothetical protein JO317_09340, partial [Verrucomicrobiae bacterium]|nr:hypothetical protein [Verrucomicrobiae bacterium]
MSYCVYLKRRQSLPVDQVAPLIASIPGLTMADGQQMVRRSRGFLMEHLELDQARHLVEQLRGLKIDAEFRQIRELAPNPGPVTIRAGRFSSDSCTVQDWKSQESTLLWEDVFLMSVTHLHALEIP